MSEGIEESAKASVAVPFPEIQPDGYDWLDEEPIFDPAVHLDLQPPTDITMLSDLGYRPDDIRMTATPVAFSTPLRILSNEGAAVLLDTARRLRTFQKNAADRIENMVRGGCYRSQWLRDLCLSLDVTEMMAEVYGTTVAPHTMPLHLGHLNYEPTSVGDAVDKWHHDTLPLDYVMMVSDPTILPGGRFEIFLGTKDDAATLAAAGKRPPPDRVHIPEFPGPGWAIALHGNMVVHRGGPLDSAAERITMVNGYVSLDHSSDDQSRSRDLIGIDDPALLATEWARHVAWRGVGRLQTLIDDLPFNIDNERAANRLEDAITDVQQAIEDLRSESLTTEHYEHGVELQDS